jgi:hypothetical protein
MRAETLDRLVAVGFDPELLNEPSGFWDAGRELSEWNRR